MNKLIRILYVDDYPLDRELVRDALEKEHGGFQLIEAASRSDFETRLTQGGFDLILSDFNILGFEGLQVLDTVRASGLDIPVVIVTGTGSEEVAAEAIKRGAADYVIKSPKQITRLPHIIHSVLEKKQLEISRNQAEEKLRESEDKFKYVFDHSVAGKSITLPSGELNVNQAFCDMVGYSAAELKNSKWQNITHPEDMELTNEVNEALISGRKDSVRFVKRYIHKNGSIVWADVATSLRRDKDGNPLYFMTTFLDITDHKRAEEALRESEAELRALFASMNDIVMVIDREGVYRKFAPTNPELLIKPSEELLGKPLSKVFPKKQAEAFMGAIQEVVQTKQPTQIDYDLPIGDRIVKFEASIVPLSEDNTLWVARDITARKLAEEKIIQLNAELEQRVEERTRELRQAQDKIVRQEKLAVLGQLAGGVGHELRNPLGIISNGIYYLKLIQPEADERVRKYHAMIEQQVHISEKIVTDLLDFARLESMEKEPMAVSELVQRTLLRFPVPGLIKTTLHLPSGLPRVLADTQQMEQVLGNLIVNAYQAMISPRGTSILRSTTGAEKRGELTISAKMQNGMMGITVKDTGIGITPENMKNLFEPLFTTKSKGIGLGLAVSRKLAEANGGQIEVKSEPGKGSTFTLYLPTEGI